MSSTPSSSSPNDGVALKLLLREPLLHFLIAGGVLFAVYAWLDRGAGGTAGANRAVHVTTQQVESLKESWTQQWQRPPDDRELKALVSEYLREELLAREAQALGLENGDAEVRRRLARKMEFLIQDAARIAEPSEDELRRFFDEHRDQFQTPSRVSFTHVFVDHKKRRETAVADARAILWQLREGDVSADVAHLGDRTSLPAEYFAEEKQTVVNQLGADFARAVFSAEPGRWFGPIESGYGLHLVRVTEKTAPQQKDFEEARKAVAALSHDQQQRAGEEQFYAALMKRYKVVFDESVRPLIEPGMLSGEVRP